GRLDRDEWAAVRRHPRLSARLLQRFEFVATQARAVELHHERFDGRGYYGVGDEDLPLAAHFLIVADSFDAMTSERPYRPGRSDRLAEAVRAALHADDRAAIFGELLDRIGKAWPISWGALVSWDEDGLGGRIDRQRGEGPPEAAVTSWLVREAESGADAIVAS